MAENNPNLEHEPVDGVLTIQCDDGALRAVMTVKPPFFGGKPVSEEQVMAELRRQGIVYGVNAEEIRNILNGTCDSPRVIAEGLMPVHGTDGTLTYLFEPSVENVPKEDERGMVNYKDLGFIRNISAGTVIAEITLPTEGASGINLRNQLIPQRKGVPAYVVPQRNVSLSEDGTKLLAAVDGNLKYSNGNFSVETVFDLKGDVDTSTGNLDFVGDIIIRGDVKEGFLVSSKKNITIYGTATGATLQADGELIIKKGCICSKASSGGNMTISFVENSTIKCGADLKTDALIASAVSCGGNLTAEGSKGVIMGGKCTCLKNISAVSIGTKSYLSTVITAGDNAVRINERNDCERELIKSREQFLQCEQAIAYLVKKLKAEGSLPEEKMERLSDFMKIKEQLFNSQQELSAKIEKIDEYLKKPQTVSVTCKHELYPGVKIIINDCAFQVNDVYQHCRVYLSPSGEIRADSL